MPIRATPTSWIIETDKTGYALGLDPNGLLVNRYWGARLPYPEDYPPAVDPGPWGFHNPAHLAQEEFPGYEDVKYIEPCLKLSFADGVRDVQLRFERAEISGETLILHLRDRHYPFAATLHYQALPDHDLIARWVTVTNLGDAPVRLERIFSAQWHLPRHESYRLSHLSGRFMEEFQLRREPLVHGTKILESRRITSSHNHFPWFALDRGTTAEEHGPLWFGLFEWSGNWKLAAEVTDFGTTRVSLGLNDWDFAWHLGPGEQFTTPACYGGYTEGGFGAASRALHRFVRARLPHGDALHPVLYNSWEATFFDVDLPSQSALAEQAAALGVELFVVDDGWFHRRNHDRAGLGDWWPDKTKFPAGLTPLIERVQALGMQFGLWLEPEMVNPDSELYRAHPEWVIHFPTRPRSESRNQLILNLARVDVQDHLIATFDALLRDHAISFIKWDMNRHVSEPGWPDAPHEPRELWVRYVQGLYRVWQTLRERHPHVIWQSCSGGGGRADLAMLRLADQVWPSDNTEPSARLRIQHGFSQALPANTMEAWVTDMGPPHLPLRFRFHVSMAGALGIGADIRAWSEAEHAEAAELIAQYKAVRHIVQLGDLYRLHSPLAGGISALQYLRPDLGEGLLFVFRVHSAEPSYPPPIRLRGLEPSAHYQVEGVAEPRSGAAWMADGLSITLPDFGSTMRRITRLPEGN